MGINLKSNFYSPLRYPGGKGKLAFFIQLLAQENKLLDGHYVEPFAGGASVALSMLFNEYSSHVHINDIDRNIYSFWHSVIHETDALCEMIFKSPVDSVQWKRQKEVQRNPNNYSILEVGFSTFFLNRTNRSGILNAGPIGGNSQDGLWRMDARFNRNELVSRIERIAKYKDRISIYNSDAIEFVSHLRGKLPRKTLYYFDPPYYRKGKDLYINFYNHSDHQAIASLIESMKNEFWVVSYDNEERISNLYSEYRQQIYDLSYHAGKTTSGTEIFIYANQLIVPSLNNPSTKQDIGDFCKYPELATYL